MIRWGPDPPREGPLWRQYSGIPRQKPAVYILSLICKGQHAAVQSLATSTMTTCIQYCAEATQIGNESVPIQLAQCRFFGLAISSAKILIYFSNIIYGSNSIKQNSKSVMV